MIDFRYDLVNDIVIATDHWTLRTREDVLAWHEEWKQGLKHFRVEHMPDVVIVLDDFQVADTVLSLWGEYWADLTNHYMGITYRVRSNTAAVHGAILTSGVRYNAHTCEAGSVEAAIEGIRAIRRRAQLSQRGIMASLG